MDCREITEVPIALEIMQTPEDHRLQKLFRCIYALFQGSFLRWIMRRYSHSRYKEKLWEDAKDAFQNGLMTLYSKIKGEEFEIKGSLRTTIYSFGLLQLLALFKKEKRAYSFDDYAQCFELLFEDMVLENEKHKLLNERECTLLNALSGLPKKQRTILIMKFFDKLKSKQIAERLDVSVGNVDNDATKAYKELRRVLTSEFSSPKQSYEANR
ncbi:MAG: sigma-70 family RNA polymerase sigma factor [Flavisolibacter sp.]|nr:sigma-70 family RNA polymerase sigma factor [Flavisolibacter sp.]